MVLTWGKIGQVATEYVIPGGDRLRTNLRRTLYLLCVACSSDSSLASSPSSTPHHPSWLMRHNLRTRLRILTASHRWVGFPCPCRANRSVRPTTSQDVRGLWLGSAPPPPPPRLFVGAHYVPRALLLVPGRAASKVQRFWLAECPPQLEWPLQTLVSTLRDHLEPGFAQRGAACDASHGTAPLRLWRSSTNLQTARGDRVLQERYAGVWIGFGVLQLKASTVPVEPWAGPQTWP